MSVHIIDETCSCGATFHYEGNYHLVTVARWRENHRHETINGVLVVPEGMGMKIEKNGVTQEEMDEEFGPLGDDR